MRLGTDGMGPISRGTDAVFGGTVVERCNDAASLSGFDEMLGWFEQVSPYSCPIHHMLTFPFFFRNSTVLWA